VGCTFLPPDWASSDPSSSSWDWSRDVNQLNLLRLSAAHGLDSIEVFSNSPVWWMCQNHNPSGAADGGDNIQSWNIANHSVYMATVASHLKNAWGLPVTSIELFNEPSGGWWKADGTQEGCDFAHTTQAGVLRYAGCRVTPCDEDRRAPPPPPTRAGRSPCTPPRHDGPGRRTGRRSHRS
jgi:hypothetical protein